jgi:glyoxylase-like metal-dependent hydrolase (beta-lactamase superfamily II)
MSTSAGAETGLVRLGDGAWAWLQEDKGLGWSNSGLVTGAGGLVVDTLYDLPLTRRMLDAYAEVHPDPPARLVNTHHNGDHCWGNQLLAGAEIIAHRGCAERFLEVTPERMAAIAAMPDPPEHLEHLVAAIGAFDFSGIELTPPTTVIDGDVVLDLDGRPVERLYVGPAHTEGDVVVHLPADGVLYCGDVLFHRCTPVGWEGDFATWIAALERMAALEPEHVVPGHGPLCGVDGLLELRDYLVHVVEESRVHHAAGRTPLEAAMRIELGRWAEWNEPERLAVVVHRAYKELDGGAWDEPFDRAAATLDEATLRRARFS